jgi:ribosomal protein S7
MIIKPVALTETQRIRAAWMSLIKGAGKGDSDAPFAQRLANEIMKVMAGQGSGIQHRLSEHKKAMANKLNVQVPKQTKMKRT